MQLLPPVPVLSSSSSSSGLLASATSSERAQQIQRSVSVIRSFAQQQQQQQSMSSSNSSLLRRKSKSHFGLNELPSGAVDKTRGGAASLAAKASADLLLGRQRDPDELRSLQRQLQNFPSLEELRRHPLQLATKNKKRENVTSPSGGGGNRHSLSPSSSERWFVLDSDDDLQSTTTICRTPHQQLQQAMTPTVAVAAAAADSDSSNANPLVTSCAEFVTKENKSREELAVAAVKSSNEAVKTSRGCCSSRSELDDRSSSHRHQPPFHQNIESCGMSVLQVLKVC